MIFVPILSPDPLQLHPDFSGWLPVSPPSPQRPLCLSAMPSGHISLNEQLRKEMLDKGSAFRFLIQPDGKAIALFPNSEGSYSFPKGGRTKDEDFTRQLVALNIPLPARYRMTWNEECGAWVGLLEETACKNALQASLTRRRRKDARA